MDMAYTSEELGIKSFYKYRSLDNYKYTEKMLKNGHIFLSDSTTFNDPFDSSIDETVDCTNEELRSYLIKHRFDEYEISQIISKNNNGSLDFSNIFKKNNKESFRVYCLSKNYDNLLMLSHYADKHKGICIGLKTTIFGNSLTLKCESGYLDNRIRGNNNYLPIFRVDYNNSKPDPYNLIKMNKENIKQFFFRKSKCWSYEEEYRIFLDKNIVKNNPVVINLNEISEIYLGMRIEEEQKRKIIEIINNYNCKSIRVFQMLEVKGKYQINPELISKYVYVA